MASLETLHPSAHHPGHAMHNPHFGNFTIISDCENTGNFEAAAFGLAYSTDWHPVLIGKFFRGNVSEGYYRLDGPHAISTANFFHFDQQVWYQLVFSWDKDAGSYRIFVNGVTVGVEDVGGPTPRWNQIGQMLYIGNPMFCYSEVNFFDQCLTGEEIAGRYLAGGGTPDSETNRELRKVYQEAPAEDFTVANGSKWKTELELSLTQPQHLEKFIVQGCGEATSITEQGMLIETPRHNRQHYVINADATNETHKHLDNDFRQMYLWSEKIFEGDLHVSFEFRVLEHGGLCLLIAQASGMQGEDFLNDYPPRTSGSMRAVCWEDVRNYHWEFYREMKDTRHDLQSHAMLKNPWFKPLGFKINPQIWELDRWYRLDFFQCGESITCAIDNRVIIQARDSAFDNNGPIFRQGRIAIRSMVNTRMLIRNLAVKSRPDIHVLE